jgi:hypothetical protein
MMRLEYKEPKKMNFYRSYFSLLVIHIQNMDPKELAREVANVLGNVGDRLLNREDMSDSVHMFRRTIESILSTGSVCDFVEFCNELMGRLLITVPRGSYDGIWADLEHQYRGRTELVMLISIVDLRRQLLLDLGWSCPYPRTTGGDVITAHFTALARLRYSKMFSLLNLVMMYRCGAILMRYNEKAHIEFSNSILAEFLEKHKDAIAKIEGLDHITQGSFGSSVKAALPRKK